MAIRVAKCLLLRPCWNFSGPLVLKTRPGTLAFSRRLQSTHDSANDSATPKSSGTFSQNGVKIDTSFLARQFINTLDANERHIIKEELIRAEAEAESQLGPDGKKIVAKPTWKQLLMIGFQSGLPFIGFGFVDNFLMIVAGDLIESYIGIFLPISTMAAAGLGNGFSDVAGIGLSHHIEYYCSKFIGEMKLTPEQFNLRIVSWVIVISKSLCIFIGCVIGMAPLLFIDHNPSEKEAKSGKNDSTNQIEKVPPSQK